LEPAGLEGPLEDLGGFDGTYMIHMAYIGITIGISMEI